MNLKHKEPEDNSGMYNNTWGSTVYPQFSQTALHQPLLPASLAKHPQQWTRDEVGVWLKWCVEEFAIDNVPPDKFDMNGKALCLLKRSDFMERLPKNGDLLYNALQKLMQKNSGNIICQQLPAYPNIIPPCSVNYPASFQHKGSENIQPGGVVIFPTTTSTKPTLKKSSSPPGVCMTSTDSNITTVNTPRGRPFVPILPHPQRPQPIPLACPPQTGHLQSSQSDISPFNPVTSVPGILSPATSTADTESASDDDIDGRANDEMKIDTSGMNFLIDIPQSALSTDITPLFRKQDSGMYCRLLWEFIHQLLQDPNYSSYVCWENKNDFVFRIINPTGLAELWGHQKNRTNMTYEKLSRALRYYYRMNIIKKVSGKRLTYKFMQPPSNIQKGQRGAKPHNKSVQPRSPPELESSTENPVNLTLFHNNHTNEVQQALDIAKTLCFNGHAIKSEPMDFPHVNVYKNSDSASSPTTKNRGSSSNSPPNVTNSEQPSDTTFNRSIFPIPQTVSNTLESVKRTSPKQAHLNSPVIKTEPYFIPRTAAEQTTSENVDSSQISTNIIKNTESSDKCFKRNIFDSVKATSPRQAHTSPPIIKTEPYFIPRPLSEQTTLEILEQEPQDFTMSTLKRKHRESVDSDEGIKYKRSDNINDINSNYSFNNS